MEIVELFKNHPYHRPGRGEGWLPSVEWTADIRPLSLFLSRTLCFLSLSLVLSCISNGEIPPPTSRMPRRRGIDEGRTRGKSPNRIPRRGWTFNGLETIYPFRSRVATLLLIRSHEENEKRASYHCSSHLETERTSPSCHRACESFDFGCR